MKVVFQGMRLKIARAIQLHYSADLLPAIFQAKSNIFNLVKSF